MRIFRFIRKLIFGATPDAKFLTPDGNPRADAKTEGKVALAAPVRVRSGKPIILYVITKSNFGGAQKYVYDLATHAPGDMEAVVMCGPGVGNLEGGLLVAKLTEYNIRTVIIPALKRDVGFADFRAYWALYKAIREEAPAVLHLNSSKAGGLGALAGRLARVPNIIFTAHGWAFSEARRPLARFVIWCASVATILLCHKVICVSAYDRNQFRGWFFANKLVAIHNAVADLDLDEREDARRDLVSHADLYTKEIWVGSVVELTPNKNVSLAIQAVKKARGMGANIFYAIVGDGEERLTLEDQVAELGMKDEIRFLGFVSDASRFLNAFDIALLTSRKEGLPYFVLECLEARLPIIVSNVGGISEIVRDGENGILCQSENVDQFAEALVKLAKDEQLRRELASHPPQNSFDTMLRETFDLYR